MHKHGFELIEERQLAEAGGTGRLWRHVSSGAQLLSITNSDENKCFGASFYTPPTDSTGVAHILEHSVLCGSQRYPLKEPFAELLKGSLQTFLNAFTFPDKTCYPVASANLQDFYNLVDVYLDAVFHPLLSKETFQQEGWHVEAETADGPWTFKGVVYNEMKGVYSSPESILAEQSQQAVFPDNLYCLDSGGNPERIPDLTYEAFVDFHNRYYQPGNTRFFFWGDDPEEERLKRIAAVVEGYGPASDLPVIALQKKPARPRHIQVPYAASETEDRALFTINWLLPERGNVAEALKLEMLEHILEGLPGSPLRRALMESGLGEDTVGCGLETDLRQMYYSTGLKGIAPADAAKVEALVLRTLATLADNGIDGTAIEAAVNSVEFALREDNSGRFPRGLAAMIMSLSTWLYGGDPMAPLAWEQPLATIKRSLEQGEKVFEKTIREYFLDNPHICVTLLPDQSLGESRQNAEKARLAEIQAQAGPDERQQMALATASLIEAQLKPDTPEDLARIPSLGIADLPRANATIPTHISADNGHEFITHDLPTRGVAYATILLPVANLEKHLVPLLPLFCRSLIECGSAHSDYSELGTKIATKTGGLGASILTGTHLQSGQTFCYLAFAGKSVYEKISAMFDLLAEIIMEPQNNADIMRQRLELMLLEARARLEHGLQAAGHAAVGTRLAAHFSGEGALNEELQGISQLQNLRRLVKIMAEKPENILQDIEAIRQTLICGQNAIVSAVAEKKALGEIESRAASLLARLPTTRPAASGAKIATWKPMTDLPPGEAFLTPGQVNYVGKAANLKELGYTWNGAANVITRWLRMGRLWEEVRVAGGAYGAFCSMDRLTGVFACSSYRDPNVNRTLGAYDALARYIQTSPPASAQLEQAIVGAIGALDTYLLPDAKGAQALSWRLTGRTEEIRQKTRNEILGASPRDFQEFAAALEAFAQSGAICVLGGEKTAAAAREHAWERHKLV